MRGEIITRDEMLAIPAYEVSDLSRIAPEPLVSVTVLAYNHEAFIEQTMEGILAQQCDFPIEIIIGEDKSQDRTLAICLDYQKRYPQLIRVVTWHENVGVNANSLRVWGRARGKYVAGCEGDDYWIDPYKLTKQVAIMGESPEIMLCGARFRKLDTDKAEMRDEVFGPITMKGEYGLEDVIEAPLFHTSTYLFRSEFKMPRCADSVFCLDAVLMCAAAVQGKVRCISDVVSVYRVHAGGISARLDEANKHEIALEFLQSNMTFLDEAYLPKVRKREDIIRSFLCHEFASNGQLPRARRLAWKTVWRLGLHAPKRALVLIFHVCLPRTFQVVFDAWTRCKQWGGAVRLK